MSQQRDRLNRRDVIKYGGILGMGGMVAGCVGDGDDGGDDGGGDTEPTPTPTSTPDPMPDSFVYVTSQDPASIDPARSLDELEGIYNTNVYDPLLRYNSEFPPETVPSVATDWSVAGDGVTYTFDLRDDLEFHNGDALTAEDVVFSVERMMSIRAGPSFMWDGIMDADAATAVDDTTVEIELNQTYAPFEATLPWLFIVNRDQVLEHEQDGDWGSEWLEDNDAGSGPYALEEYARGETITLSRHDNWWGDFADNAFEEVVLDIALEVSTMVGMLETGEGHLTDRWLPVTLYEDLDEAEGVETLTTTTLNTYYIFLHSQKPPLDDVHVRRAISYAFDYDVAIDILGASEPFETPLPEGIEYHTTDGVRVYERDLDAAEAELEQSEYDIDDIEFTYAYQPAIQANADMGLMMQDELGDVGITVNLEEMTWTRMVENSTSVDTAPQSFPLWGITQHIDPDSYMYSYYHSSQINTYLNGGKYVNEEVDQLLVDGRRTIDDDERREIYHQLQQIIADDAPAIWVANDTTRYSINEDMAGFVDNGILGYTHQFQNIHYSG